MSDLIKVPEITESYLKEVVGNISNIDSFIPNETLLRLQQISDPKLRLEILSQIFYIKKISESQTYGDTLKNAVSKLGEYLKDLPFEKLLLSIDTLTKVKQASDSDISKFLVEGKESDAKMVEAQKSGTEEPKVSVTIDNRSVVNPITEKAKDVPPEILDRILRLSDSVLNLTKKKEDNI